MPRSLTNTEQQFVDAADAMPADKFDFAPTTGEFKGVRTFGQLLKHTAATNMFVASILTGEKPPNGGFEGPEDVKGKEAIMKYVNDSFEDPQGNGQTEQGLGHRATSEPVQPEGTE